MTYKKFPSLALYSFKALNALKSFLLVFFLLYTLNLNTACAARQYRCNGKVQYRPCEQVIKEEIETKKALLPLPSLPVEAIFTRISETRGVWDGDIYHSGDISLLLEFYRSGSLVERRFLGKTVINDASTWFKFETNIPTDNEWGWRIVATKK